MAYFKTFIVVTLIVLLGSCSDNTVSKDAADDTHNGSIKENFKDMGSSIGHAARDVTRSIGHDSRNIVDGD